MDGDTWNIKVTAISLQLFTLHPYLIGKDLIFANSNILTRKKLEEMSVTKLIDFTMNILEDMIFGQNKLFTEIDRKTEIDRIDRNLE